MPAVSAFWKFHLQNAGHSVAIATLCFAVLQNVLQKEGRKNPLSVHNPGDREVKEASKTPF